MRKGITMKKIAMIWVLFAAATAHSEVGISTRFVDVIIEYMQVGKAYNLRELKAVPYSVKNRSSAAMSINVEVSIPKKEELVKEYEPVPDPAWVTIVPNRFRVEPGQTGYAQVILQVPDDPKYIGRHFQAKVSANTADNPYMIAAGVESRLRFSTGPGPDTLRQQKQKQAMMTLDFDVTPQTLYADGLEIGKTTDFKKEKRRPIKVTNRSDTTLKLNFVSTSWDKSFPLGDYEPAPDPDWLKFDPVELESQGDSISSAYPIITIPNDEKYYGKKYAFLIRTELKMGVELEYFNRIYIKVKAKDE